ncbi:hypothetical protein D7B24_004286 [Verticillium nonalfalfae]|uniref:Uncharacterized protein n=1 Tax=Verticillium nonalfalfae TaxID=1051616 RepID=A0A3M9YEZ7_9PEZI|nr:uncharacterized protein D7B24_004286 [Verticillium nonalfalfae]RNJ58651.1 hypothetical protein D7B24_004286 [Verticillium nonalfalfae]
MDCTEVSPDCPVELSFYGAFLSKGAAIFFGVSFILLLFTQFYFGFKARTWSFMIWLAIGTGFEVVGYAARVLIAGDPFETNYFIIHLITLLLAPTLVAAAISITFKRLVLWYGSQWSLLRPSLYPWVFVGTDFVSIFIQVIGGGATATVATGSGNEAVRKLGEAMIISGVVFQVVNMLCCSILMLVYVRRRKKALLEGPAEIGSDQQHLNPTNRGVIPLSRSEATDQEARRVTLFVYAIAIAYAAIIIRCCYRIAESIPAIAKDVMRNEAVFLVLDGAMILIAIGSVTAFHPYKFFPYLGMKTLKEKNVSTQEGYQMGNM